VAAHATFGLIFSYYYVAAHFFVTFGLLGYLWWRKPRTYRPLRTRLVVINLIGLAVFWLYRSLRRGCSVSTAFAM